ncbi:hypothetical protein J6590_010567 [Homalodisca vitripennis]|nr:hypothetical protein J6590_010567 [Homalodisca vitripennis]
MWYSFICSSRHIGFTVLTLTRDNAHYRPSMLETRQSTGLSTVPLPSSLALSLTRTLLLSPAATIETPLPTYKKSCFIFSFIMLNLSFGGVRWLAWCPCPRPQVYLSHPICPPGSLLLSTIMINYSLLDARTGRTARWRPASSLILEYGNWSQKQNSTI